METSKSDTGLQCLTLLLRFHQVAVDPAQIAHEFSGEAIGVTEMLRCAKQLKLKARAVREDWAGLMKLPLPAIVERRTGGFVIVGKVSDEGALVQDPAANRPQAIKRAEFESDWTGRVVLMARRASLADLGRRFDITWFLQATRLGKYWTRLQNLGSSFPAVGYGSRKTLSSTPRAQRRATIYYKSEVAPNTCSASMHKYRRLLGEVLLASFFLQLFALVTPLFFQVVTDKVLTHRGFTTLDVLVLRLITVTIFETILGGLRTYVFSHTTNRIDVMLRVGVAVRKSLVLVGLLFSFSSAVAGPTDRGPVAPGVGAVAANSACPSADFAGFPQAFSARPALQRRYTRFPLKFGLLDASHLLDEDEGYKKSTIYSFEKIPNYFAADGTVFPTPTRIQKSGLKTKTISVENSRAAKDKDGYPEEIVTDDATVAVLVTLPDSGVQVYYRFRRMQGCWFLYAISDRST